MGRTSRTQGRRGVLLAAALLVALLAVMDLARTDSLVRAVWRGLVTDEGAPIERVLPGSAILHRR